MIILRIKLILFWKPLYQFIKLNKKSKPKTARLGAVLVFREGIIAFFGVEKLS